MTSHRWIEFSKYSRFYRSQLDGFKIHFDKLYSKLSPKNYYLLYHFVGLSNIYEIIDCVHIWRLCFVQYRY